MVRLIWKLFVVQLVLIGIYLTAALLGIKLLQFDSFFILILGLPVVLMVLHAIHLLGLVRSLSLMSLAAGIGWIMETVGLNDGTFFGGRYVYLGQSFLIGTVPLSVVLYWAVFIYTGYSITSAFFEWWKKMKPNYKDHSFLWLIMAVVLDGWFVTAIDLFMDPIQVREGRWAWLDGGPYFGVPIGNFVGWFVVTILVTGIFRTYEYFRPHKKVSVSQSFSFIPVVGYFLLAVAFSVSAIEMGMPELLFFGWLSMFPALALSFLRLKSKQ